MACVRCGDDADDEAGLLLDEMNHRTANLAAVAIAALRRVGAGLSDSGHVRLVEVALARLDALGLVHASLARRDGADVDLAEDLEAVATASLHFGERSGGIEIVLDCESIVVPGATAWCARAIVAELVANAVRHAFPVDGRPGGSAMGAVRVHGRRLPGAYRLAVLDDGVGLDVASIDGAARTRGGLGTGIISRIARRLDGTIERNMVPDGGTAVVLTFPVEPAFVRASGVVAVTSPGPGLAR